MRCRSPTVALLASTASMSSWTLRQCLNPKDPSRDSFRANSIKSGWKTTAVAWLTAPLAFLFFLDDTGVEFGVPTLATAVLGAVCVAKT